MKYSLPILMPLVLAVWALSAPGGSGSASAQEPRCKGAWACYSPYCQRPWNDGFYDVAWGSPVALVVPPNVEVQTHWGWGVGNTRVTPICSQYNRAWWGPGYYYRGAFQPTPHWPSDTDQFGVYYVRGPW